MLAYLPLGEKKYAYVRQVTRKLNKSGSSMLPSHTSSTLPRGIKRVAGEDKWFTMPSSLHSGPLGPSSGWAGSLLLWMCFRALCHVGPPSNSAQHPTPFPQQSHHLLLRLLSEGQRPSPWRLSGSPDKVSPLPSSLCTWGRPTTLGGSPAGGKPCPSLQSLAHTGLRSHWARLSWYKAASEISTKD